MKSRIYVGVYRGAADSRVFSRYWRWGRFCWTADFQRFSWEIIRKMTFSHNLPPLVWECYTPIKQIRQFSWQNPVAGRDGQPTG